MTSYVASGNQVALPQVVALERGQRYRWSVSAYDSNGQKLADSPPSLPAYFEILSSAKASEAETSVKRYASSPLLAGVAYARYGLIDEAERELRRHLESNRGDVIAQKLLGQLRAQKGIVLKEHK